MIDFDQNSRPVLGEPAARQYWDGSDGTLPSWLTTLPTTVATIGEGATYTIQDPATALPGLFMSTAAVASRSAILQGPTLDLTKYRAVRLRLRFDASTSGTTMGIIQICLTDAPTPTRGVRFGKFRTDSTSEPTLIAVTAASTTRLIQSGFPYFQNAKKYDVSLLLDCVDKDVYLMMDDTVIDIWPAVGANLDLGSVVPSLRLANNSSAALARSVTVRAVTLERWV